MSASTSPPQELLDREVVALLERGLGERRGRRVRIARVEHSSLDGYSTHPISHLRVDLANGDGEVPVIFKRLRQKPGAEVARELWVYRRLLAGGGFGAPQLLASVCDPARERFWLLLEDVGSRPLDWYEADRWEEAFRLLARMHAEHAGRERELNTLGCLVEHGPTFYRWLTDGARASIYCAGPAAARVRFDGLAARVDAVFAALDREPRTLLHGDMSGQNVLVQRGRGPRPIDWEWAAIGPAAWDVGKLAAGWGSRKAGFVDAYLEECAGRGVPVDRSGFERALARCDAVRALWYLHWWVDGCADPAFVDTLLDRIEQAIELDRG